MDHHKSVKIGENGIRKMEVVKVCLNMSCRQVTADKAKTSARVFFFFVTMGGVCDETDILESQ